MTQTKTNTKKKPVKFYWTKKRKRELRKWQVLGVVSFLAVVTLGGAGEFTKKYIVDFKLAEIAYAKEEPLAEISREPIEDHVRRLAKEANFQWVEYLVALMECENLRFPGDFLDPNRDNVTGNNPANSTDRGLFMINNYWHYEISDDCAHDIECSTKWTMKRITDGYQHEWMCDYKAKNR